MIKEAIGYGATIEEAYEDAVLKLNVKDDDDIQFDVISQAKKKVLGLFGGSQAQVRAYIELPDQKKKEKPVKKGGVLGKILMLLLGILLGIVLTVGSVVGVGYWLTQQPLKKTVVLIPSPS